MVSFWLLLTLFVCDVGVITNIAFSSDHWPVSVSCAPSKRWNLRQRASIRTSRILAGGVPLINLLLASMIWLAVTPGTLATKIASLCSVACEQAVLLAVHGVSDDLQELLNPHQNVADVAEQRLISKTIWRMRRKERRKRAVETVSSPVESRRDPGPLLSGSSNHLNWSDVFGAQTRAQRRGVGD